MIQVECDGLTALQVSVGLQFPELLYTRASLGRAASGCVMGMRLAISSFPFHPTVHITCDLVDVFSGAGQN